VWGWPDSINLFKVAIRAWISLTELLKFLALRLSPYHFMQYILVSTELCRCYPNYFSPSFFLSVCRFLIIHFYLKIPFFVFLGVCIFSWWNYDRCLMIWNELSAVFYIISAIGIDRIYAFIRGWFDQVNHWVPVNRWYRSGWVELHLFAAF